MGAMSRDAPPSPSRADRLSAPLAGIDDPVNALHDDLNRRLPWLWWPLRVPAAGVRMDLPRHALYAVHAGGGVALAAAVIRGRSRTAVLVAGGVIAVASWALFSGAWDRRADRLRDADWDAYDADGPEA